MEHWTDFGVGQFPSFSARKRVELPPPMEALVGERAGAVQRPLQGLTSDGTVRPGLFPLRLNRCEHGADHRRCEPFPRCAQR